MNHETLRAHTTKLGLLWISDEDATRATAILRGDGGQIPDQNPSASHAFRQRARLAAYGPSRALDEKPLTGALWLDEADPGTVFLALSPDALPRTWLAVDATPSAVEAALGELFGPPDESTAPREFVCFAGLLQPHDGFSGLEQWMLSCPFTAGALRLPSDEEVATGESVSRYETAYSGSVVTLHAIDGLAEDATMLLAKVRYAPAPHAATVARFREECPSDWPDDLPLDALCALGHLMAIDLGNLARLGERGDEILLLAHCLLTSATAFDEARLGRWADSSDAPFGEAWLAHADPVVRERADRLARAVAERFARTGVQDSEASFDRLDALVSGGDWDGALALGRALQANAPERFEAWEAIALSCTFTGRHAEAIEAYEAALARYAPAPMTLGPALDALAAVVGHEDRRRGRMLFNLACEYANAGDADRAIGRLAEAIESSPTGHWRREAEGDAYLDGIRDDPRFVAAMRGR